MKTLRMLTVGMLLAATATWASAGEESGVPTFTVTAKRLATALAVEHVPPSSAIEIAVLLHTDMPEAEIDYRLSPFGAPPAPAVERATL
jgi:hypothetical protein